MTLSMLGQTSGLKAAVKEKYGQAALRVTDGSTDASCCGSSMSRCRMSRST